jgi:hypothetical protein
MYVDLCNFVNKLDEMPLISSMAVTFIGQRRELFHYQSDVPGHRGCTHAVPATPPRHVGVIINSAVEVAVFRKWSTIRNEKVQPKNLGEISEMIERFYICQQSAEYSVCSKGSA